MLSELKYVTLVDALGSVSEPKSPNSRPGLAGSTAEPFQIEIGVPN